VEESLSKAALAREALGFRHPVGRRLAGLRVKRGMNQDEFAFKAGIHSSHVGKIENATLNPTLETLYKYAKGLEMEVWELLQVSK
jgi:transcriptional regulator with XRE-family HTH domain